MSRARLLACLEPDDPHYSDWADIEARPRHTLRYMDTEPRYQLMRWHTGKDTQEVFSVNAERKLMLHLRDRLTGLGKPDVIWYVRHPHYAGPVEWLSDAERDAFTEERSRARR